MFALTVLPRNYIAMSLNLPSTLNANVSKILVGFPSGAIEISNKMCYISWSNDFVSKRTEFKFVVFLAATLFYLTQIYTSVNTGRGI